jgi:hypothetical protein
LLARCADALAQPDAGTGGAVFPDAVRIGGSRFRSIFLTHGFSFSNGFPILILFGKTENSLTRNAELIP